MNTDTPLLRDNHGNAREVPAMTPYVLLLFGAALVCLILTFAVGLATPEAQELSPADTDRPGPQATHTPTEETE